MFAQAVIIAQGSRQSYVVRIVRRLSALSRWRRLRSTFLVPDEYGFEFDVRSTLLTEYRVREAVD